MKMIPNKFVDNVCVSQFFCQLNLINKIHTTQALIANLILHWKWGFYNDYVGSYIMQ